jgi:hypothetical protein
MLLLASFAAPLGCGGHDEPDRPAKRTTAPTPGRHTSTRTTAPGPSRTATVPRRPGRAAPSEEQPGGAGDEEPIRSQALFSGTAGRVLPSVVHVPPFIAIRVELRSLDARPYALRFGAKALRARAGRGSELTLEGLRPRRTVVGRSSSGGVVRIVADAQPGP